jgi:transposase
MKLEIVVDANGIPLGTKIAAANRAETDLLEEALDDIPVPLPDVPEGSPPIPLVADRGYDCDPLRDRLLERGIELLSPHRHNRTRPSRNDGRRMRRYARRFVVERTNSWLHNYRRLVVRHEYYSFIFHGFVRLACIMIAISRL